MKSKRQAKIMEIISTTNVETQEQLLEALREAGFNSTQATISRDIKELRIIKELTSFGTYHYTAAAREVPDAFSGRLNTIFRECVTSFDYAQNIIVIHTLPGLANAAASALDTMSRSVVLGSIAGDDTVIIIMRDTNAAASFCGEIKNLLS
ncbi:MAG: arginine repressor [Candidatus Faecousia sp.]|nr:arginine repressor [Candidatus Faecousia sp.]